MIPSCSGRQRRAKVSGVDGGTALNFHQRLHGIQDVHNPARFTRMGQVNLHVSQHLRLSNGPEQGGAVNG
jgi:hypothetical protein